MILTDLPCGVICLPMLMRDCVTGSWTLNELQSRIEMILKRTLQTMGLQKLLIVL